MTANPKTDPVPLMLTLLNTTWDIANTSGVKPKMLDGGGGVSYRREVPGLIKVYQEGPVRREALVVNGDFKFHWEPVTIEVNASGRAKLFEMLNEVERVVNLKRNNPDGYWDWIEDMGEVPRAQYPEWSCTAFHVEFVAHSVAIAV